MYVEKFINASQKLCKKTFSGKLERAAQIHSIELSLLGIFLDFAFINGKLLFFDLI